jgi:aryl-alcohol dehydrogenase-like predicted oxidoreductase
MERRKLGTSGLEVPAIGVGTWMTFDVRGRRGEADARARVDEALQAGADLFDSSPMYGESERVVGEAVEGRRDSVQIATKVWTSDDDQAGRQIERSLRYFGGHVELYQVHNLVAWPRRLDQLSRLQAEGIVKAVGATHYSPSAFGELAGIMRSGRISAVQIPYHAALREAEREILPLAENLGIGVVVMTPLGAGRLVRRPPPNHELAPLVPFGIRTWAQALLKWVLSDSRCHIAIPATSLLGRTTENAEAGHPPWFGPEERELVSRLATA